METKNLLSLLLFVAFIGSYCAKLIVLKRKNIKAYVLGKGGKPSPANNIELVVKIGTFFWGSAWVLQVFFEGQITRAVGCFFILPYPIGLVIIACGILVFIKAMIDMKNSWRVGIDKKAESDLITYGVYSISRNPAFVGFDLMFIGLFLLYSNVLTLFIAGVNILGLHFQILQEEKHLISLHGNQYREYTKCTPRYFGFKL